jgi:hypothetical protein
MAIRGGNLGGSDGIDVWGTNYWIHDIEVTNRDECVTVKSPANHIQVEQIWCNQSGGSAIGSLGTNTTVQNVLYRNVYTNGGNQIFMIKSNGGSGFVKNVQLQNFISRGTAYGLDVDQYWSSESMQAGNGVALSNIVFSVRVISFPFSFGYAEAICMHFIISELGRLCRRWRETLPYPDTLCGWGTMHKHSAPERQAVVCN